MLAIVAVLISLGVWQLNRLDQRQEQNNLYQARTEEEPLIPSELQRLLEAGTPKEDLELRSIQLEGEYRYFSEEQDRESVVRNRTFSGFPGVWMLTPFEVQDGSVLIINRGWILRVDSSTACRDEAGEEAPYARPPQGRIQIIGVLRLAEGSTPDSTEWKKCLSKVELAGFEDLTDIPFWIQLQDFDFLDPDTNEFRLTSLESVDRGNGPHLSYAVQWFIFATLVVITYPLILRSNHRNKISKSKEL